jgi:type 1 glutamine amidotransferase
MKSFSRQLLCAVLLSTVFLTGVAANHLKPKPRILVFCKTSGFHHKSIVNGIKAIQELGAKNGFDVDTSTDANIVLSDQMYKYKAVVFLSTTGDIFNDAQQEAFKKYIQSGVGFVGIHAATDCEYDWPWYGNLVGAYFGGHPAQQTATLHVADKNNIATRHLPDPWQRKDEWYSFKWMATGLHVLLTIDESSYSQGKIKPMGYHPMAWYHEYDGARVFYTELGHTEESYTDPLYLQHLLGGIEYALGKKPGAKLHFKN